MTYRVAINGFGRIGRDYLRAVLDRDLLGSRIDVVAVNDLGDAGTLARLLAHDATAGPVRADVTSDRDGIAVDGYRIPVSARPDPLDLAWAERGVDLVVEATGKLRGRDDAARHLKAGATRVLISAPGRNVDATLVVGVNDDTYDPVAHEVVSAASGSTACVAAMLSVLQRAFGVERGYLTTVHAYPDDQALPDPAHQDPGPAGSAAAIIPGTSGAATAVGLVLPELAGRLHGVALRVPVDNASVCDLTCELFSPATADQVNAAFAAAARDRLAGVLRCTATPVVSRDVLRDPVSCVFDAGLTRASGTMVKVFGWYDNEWGYTNRLVDLSLLMAERSAS